ncbi:MULTISPECIES: hypothetical protein [Paenibacillus]|uniref:Uncharacterized protein n=1 Tax=Paenibacillus borealis TaxID=160799 RepID=A0ABX3HSL5_PAEBO|nr:hypothetical protein [Paenibacillus borealis]OMD53084.1 hypothetical protein BSK56_02310 [Paenibacillus borealis]
MIKLLGLGVAASLLFTPITGLVDSPSLQKSSVSEVSSAKSYSFNNYIYEEPGTGTKILVGDGVKVPELARGKEAVKIVRVNQKGGAFNDSFTCEPDDGVNLNIWMMNNNGQSVQFQVWRNGVEFTNQAIAVGSQKTISFTDMLGNGLDGNYEVYIYSLLGYPLDVDVSARQF